MNKIKLYLATLITIVCLGGCGGKPNQNSNKLVLNDTIPGASGMAKSVVYTDLMPIYLDSIKNFERSGVIPAFFEDQDLDLKYGMISLHNYHSFRLALFNSTESTRLLQAIIDAKGDTYQKKPTKSKNDSNGFPDLSTREMALLRLQFIQQENEKR